MSDDQPQDASVSEDSPAETSGGGGSQPTEIIPAEAGAGSLEQTIADRLQALDHLYENKAITATELGDARRKILAGAAPNEIAAPVAGAAALPVVEPAQVPAETTAQPPAAPPPPVPPQIVDGGHVGPPEPPAEKKIAGLPVWAASLVGVLVIGLIVLGAVLLLGGGGGDDDNAANAAGASTDTTYAKKIGTPLRQLTNSAVATGKSLARVSEPNQIRQLNRTVERQIDVVEGARSALTRISVVPADQRAHRALITAAATQRRYLVALGRASAGTPSRAKLDALNKARRTGALAITSYRTFFRLAPAAPDAITTTDLTDTSGLKSAINAAIASSSSPTSRGGSNPAPQHIGPYTGTSFQSPTGNLRCELSGGSLICSASNATFAVSLPSFGAPSTFTGIAAGGVVVPYGSTWSGGGFNCDSAYDGITCRNQSGNGFFLNRTTYNPF